MLFKLGRYVLRYDINLEQTIKYPKTVELDYLQATMTINCSNKYCQESCVSDGNGFTGPRSGVWSQSRSNRASLSCPCYTIHKY